MRERERERLPVCLCVCINKIDCRWLASEVNWKSHMQWQVDLLQLSLCLTISLSLHISLPFSCSSSRWSIRLGVSWRLLQFQVAQLENSFDALLRDEAGRCHNQIAAKATIANCWVANVLCNHVCVAVCVCVRVCVWHCDVATKSHRKKLPPVLCLSSFSYSFRLWFSASVFGFSFFFFFGFFRLCLQLLQLSVGSAFIFGFGFGFGWANKFAAFLGSPNLHGKLN